MAKCNQINKRMLTKNKENVTLSFEKGDWEKFKKVMKKLGTTSSDLFGELMNPIIDASEFGGAVTIEINGNEISLTNYFIKESKSKGDSK